MSFEQPAPQSRPQSDLPPPRQDRLITLQEILDTGIPNCSLIDARSDDEYEGKTTSGNTRKGHMEGAIHLEWNQLLENSKDANAIRKFKSADDIHELLDAAGITKDKTWSPYCQAGVRAAFMGYVLELMGYPRPRVYDGSMGEWANEEDTPLEL